MNELGDGTATGQSGGGMAGRSSGRTAWISGARNWWLPGFSLALVAVLIVWRWKSVGPGILALLILPGIVVTLSSVRVIAGQVGVRVGLGRWGWPAKVVDYTDIVSAAVEQISPHPSEVGGTA